MIAVTNTQKSDIIRYQTLSNYQTGKMLNLLFLQSKQEKKTNPKSTTFTKILVFYFWNIYMQHALK